MEAFAYDELGRSHRVKITPTALFDLMLVTDYMPPLRAAIPIGVKAALEGDGALLARLIREGGGSIARLSARLLGRPLLDRVRDDAAAVGPGHADRSAPGVTQQRIAALPPNTFAPFDPAVVVEDEIDLCLRWPDVPRVLGVPPPPYPTVPTLILQGGEDLRTPPEWSANVAARIPGAQRIVIPGVGHSTVSDPRDCAADAILRFVAAARRRSRASASRPACRRCRRRPRRSSRCGGVRGYPRKIGRTLRAVLATLYDLDLVLSPATLTGSGGGLRGGSWAVEGRRLVLRDYQAVTGVTVSGGGDLRAR